MVDRFTVLQVYSKYRIGRRFLRPICLNKPWKFMHRFDECHNPSNNRNEFKLFDTQREKKKKKEKKDARSSVFVSLVWILSLSSQMHRRYHIQIEETKDLYMAIDRCNNIFLSFLSFSRLFLIIQGGFPTPSLIDTLIPTDRKRTQGLPCLFTLVMLPPRWRPDWT